MQLIYRGNHYDMSSPAKSETEFRPSLKLIYRGYRFDYMPHPAKAVAEVPADAPTVTLIYRGTSYQRQLSAAKPYQQTRSVNWRWQVS